MHEKSPFTFQVMIIMMTLMIIMMTLMIVMIKTMTLMIMIIVTMTMTMIFSMITMLRTFSSKESVGCKASTWSAGDSQICSFLFLNLLQIVSSNFPFLQFYQNSSNSRNIFQHSSTFSNFFQLSQNFLNFLRFHIQHF